MTIPTGGGTDPFDYGDDVVAARVSVDVPADSAANLESIIRGTAELRTNMEATARANASVIDYLREMPTLLTQVGEATGRYQDSIVIGSGGGPNPRVPLSGRNDPTPAGASDQASGSGSGRGDTRAADDVVRDLNDLEERDPRQAANMRAQRNQGNRRNAGARPSAPSRPGSGRPRNRPDSPSPEHDPDPENNGDGSPDDYDFVDTRANRLQGTRDTAPETSTDALTRAQQFGTQGQNFVNQVLQETRQGQSGMGNSSAAIRGVRTGAQAAQGLIERRALAAHIAEGGTAESFRGAAAQGGRMGAAAAGLGTAAKFAGAAGVAYMAVDASQKIGEQYQGYKNQGMIRGGGASEGVGYEMQIRTMAMNPFLNTEQSRKIINTALSEGYTGKEFDTVTKFMSENLKDMNLSVADSVKLLNSNVNEGGQSIAQLNTQLNTMKDLAGGGYATLQDRQEIFAKVSGQAVENGSSGEQAGDFGTLAGEFLSDNKMLAGSGGDFASSLQTNINAQRGIRAEYEGVRGLSPQDVVGTALEINGGDSTAVFAAGVKGVEQAFQQRFAQQYANAKTPAERSRLNRQALIFWKQNGFPNADLPKATELSALALKGELSKGVEGASDEIKQSEDEITGSGTESGGKRAAMALPRALGATAETLGAVVSAAGNAIDDTVGVIGGLFGIGDGKDRLFSDTAKNWNENVNDLDNSTASFKNDRIQGLVSQYGADDIKVVGEDGKESNLSQGNGDQIRSIVAGTSKLKIQGGEAMSLSEAEASAGDQGSGGNTTTRVALDLTPLAKKLVQSMGTDDRTNTQYNSDAGINGSNRSSPTPSEQAPR